MSISVLGFVLSFGIQPDDAKQFHGMWVCQSLNLLHDPTHEQLGGRSVYEFDGRRWMHSFGQIDIAAGYYRVVDGKKIVWYCTSDPGIMEENFRLQGDDLVLWDDEGNVRKLKRLKPQVVGQTSPGVRPIDTLHTQGTYPHHRYGDVLPALSPGNAENKKQELVSPTPNTPQMSPCCPCPQPRRLRRWHR